MVRLSELISGEGAPDGDEPPERKSEPANFPREPGLLSREARDGQSLAQQLYRDTVSVMEGILACAGRGDSIDASALVGLLDKMSNRVLLESSELARLALVNHEGDQPAVHAVNVAILAMMIGDELGKPKTKIVQLGAAGLLADASLAPLGDITSCARALTDSERELVQKHPLEARVVLSQVSGMDAGDLLPMIEQHHERCDGSGYPRQLRAAMVSEDAQIVGLADVYEALTHARPHRDKALPFAAMKDITGSMREMFAPGLLRALISRMAIYPAGSHVELSTGEVARVYEVNRDQPLNPVVDVVLDRDHRRVEQIMRVDLRTRPSLYIRGPIRESDIEAE